jgi:hypothetical protein
MRIKISLLFLASLAVWALDSAVAQNKADTKPFTIIGLENKWNAAYQRGDIAAIAARPGTAWEYGVHDGVRGNS